MDFSEKLMEKYALIEDRPVPDLNSEGIYLRHKKSGARVLVLANDDNNKVFNIGFRTPVSDSTGVPHIIEHTVLCGSREFPGKDPFVELVKGSLNTFLNAMTYSDKTVFPVASCNMADFRNLMHVYMDAVFYPNIYKKEEIFKQEGWHYELESPEGELTINGVVYNEMKGAFSSVDDVLERLILNSLFPETNYAYESGGDPEDIPNLTYEQFLDFHRKYYHPSNSYIYLYGDVDVEERLLWMDENYLGDFEKITVDSEIRLQKPFDEIRYIEKEYPISMGEEEKDNTYLSYNKVIGTSLDIEHCLAFDILEYALLGSSGAPLKQALLDAGIGKTILSDFDSGIRQPIFSVIAKNANPEDRERFVSLIEETLATIAEEGVDEKALLAGINYYEFRYREADYGPYPKGLMYGLNLFDSWLYDDARPLLHVEALDVYKFLKEQVGTGYYETLIKRFLLENNHGSVVMITPKKGLAAQIEALKREELAAYKASLSDSEIAKIIKETEELTVFQETPDSQEDMDKIPVLELKDIDRETKVPPIRKDGDLLVTEIDTRGIAYLTLHFNMEGLDEQELAMATFLTKILGYVNTENYSYQELYNEMNRTTGGLTHSTTTFSNSKAAKKYTVCYTVEGKALYSQLEQLFALLEEVLFTSDLTDKKRIREILLKNVSGKQTSLASSGHATAALRALSYVSPLGYVSDLTGGIGYYRCIEEMAAQYDERFDEISGVMCELMGRIFKKENMIAHVTAQSEGIEIVKAQMEKLAERFAAAAKAPACENAKGLVFAPKNDCREGFKTAAKVQYVASAGNYLDAGLPYTGALRILKVILNYDYLWINIRVKGGAYGCMSSFTRNGDSYFATYRDPNLRESREIFLGTGDYLRTFDADEQTMRKYIIGTVSEMDTPLNPSAQGKRALSMYFTELTEEDVLKEREQVLDATAADIRALGDYADAVLAGDHLCVVGGEEKIEAEKELFTNVENLIRS